MGPGKRSKHSAGFKIKVIQFAKENGNRAAARIWCSRFMARNNLVLREKTKVSQMLPKDVDNKSISFQKYVIGLRKQKKYLLSHIGNMDETPVTFDMIRNKTIDMKGTKTIHINTTGHEKSHFIVVLSCLADGTKLKPMVIFKRKTVPKSNFPKGVFIHVHEKGWMDENGVKLWIKKYLAKASRGLTESTKSISLMEQKMCDLFMEESNSDDGENDTDFDDVPEDITEDEYVDLFMLFNNEGS
ncbi:pogo transposable element with KRAB domain [Trichonephila clavipes]|nr:pogo transposable element with KRAB domain [Trichonephila clavipes]